MIATAFIYLSIDCLFVAAEWKNRVNTVIMPGGGGGAAGAAAAAQRASIPDFMAQMMAAPQ
jgi:hypothetical protein